MPLLASWRSYGISRKLNPFHSYLNSAAGSISLMRRLNRLLEVLAFSLMVQSFSLLCRTFLSHLFITYSNNTLSDKNTHFIYERMYVPSKKCSALNGL